MFHCEKSNRDKSNQFLIIFPTFRFSSDVASSTCSHHSTREKIDHDFAPHGDNDDWTATQHKPVAD